MIVEAVFVLGFVACMAAYEIDPEWLYWVLGLVVTAIVGALELVRSRPVGVSDFVDLSNRVTVLETRMPSDIAERLARLEVLATYRNGCDSGEEESK